MKSLLDFFYMHGYGVYVFSAYGCVLSLLFLQWIFPWRRWRKYQASMNSVDSSS